MKDHSDAKSKYSGDDIIKILEFLEVSLDVIILFRVVSIGHLQRVQLVNRGRLLLRTPGSVSFGICLCSNVETILS